MAIFNNPSTNKAEQNFLRKLVPVQFKDVGSHEIFVYRNQFCNKVDDTHIRLGIGTFKLTIEPFNPERKVARIEFFRYPRPIKRRRRSCVL